MRSVFFSFLIALFFFSQSFCQALSVSSTYTDVSGEMCSVVSTDEETGSTTTKCPGVGDYVLLVHSDDNRMSIAVLAPDGTRSELELWSVVTTSFSTLGNKVEWRTLVRNGKTVPISLIVRVEANIQHDPDLPQKRSYLAIAKIDKERSCVVEVIDETEDALHSARRIADEAGTRQCKNAN